MTKEREDEIRQMSREGQEALLLELRRKYATQHVLPNQPTPCTTPENSLQPTKRSNWIRKRSRLGKKLHRNFRASRLVGLP